jgi:nitrile hydratase subunit beta
MDGVHDIGGREGFGRVNWEDDEGYESFHADWEARLFAIAMQLFAQWRGKPELWTLDWFRHVRERLDPVDYLTRPYFDQWAQCLFAILIDNGAVTLAEVIGAQGTAVAMPEGKRAQAPAAESARDGAAAPAFQVGTPVRTASLIGSDHTRLPGYVRGRIGRIHSSHGPQIFADASARGDIRCEPLYTVAFAAADLWPEAAGRRDVIYVDLWESYLEAA